MELKHRLLCSTGTMVGRENGYNLLRAAEVIAKLSEENILFGGELMMLRDYYGRQREVIDTVVRSGVPYPVIHCEKDVGAELSRAATARAAGRHAVADEERLHAHDLFELNCAFGEAIGAEAVVFHLWGGYDSDTNIEINLESLPYLAETADRHALSLLIENVPSTRNDPLYNWHLIAETSKDALFIYDTRFAALHDDAEETLSDPLVRERLRHVHVSDFVGGVRNFSALRPILQPGEGVVDFRSTAQLLERIGYRGRITLESPVMHGSSLDTDTLRASLIRVRELFNTTSA